MDKIYWIADISSNHCNSLERCYEHIKQAALSGATAAKFQLFKADKLIKKEAFDSLKIGHQKKWDKSVYEIYKKYELNRDWIPKLVKCCKEWNIDFMATPYDLDAVELIDKHVKYHKIGSGDINYFDLLKRIDYCEKPVLIGTGASTTRDILECVEIFKKSEPILMQCNTEYSGNIENLRYLNLKALQYMPYNFYRTGLSDHTKSIIPIITAIVLGATFIERHFKIDENDSPDNDFSLNPLEWQEMIVVGQKTLLVLGDGVKKIEDNEIETRIIQRRDKRTGLRPDVEYMSDVGEDENERD